MIDSYTFERKISTCFIFMLKYTCTFPQKSFPQIALVELLGKATPTANKLIDINTPTHKQSSPPHEKE